jgi:hypothetical protein
MMTPHPQRCETCNNKECWYHSSKKDINQYGVGNSAWVHSRTYGCASHSSQQSKWENKEKILKRLDKEIAIRENELNRKAGEEENLTTVSGYYTAAGALNWVRNVLIKSELETIIYHSVSSEQEIRKDERDKVLVELSKWINDNSWRNDVESVVCVYSYALVQKIEELRSKGGEQ